ncbi:hypothetical protein LQW54_008042 [Pestalotiopsis sp. IQ-011]
MAHLQAAPARVLNAANVPAFVSEPYLLMGFFPIVIPDTIGFINWHLELAGWAEKDPGRNMTPAARAQTILHHAKREIWTVGDEDKTYNEMMQVFSDSFMQLLLPKFKEDADCIEIMEDDLRRFSLQLLMVLRHNERPTDRLREYTCERFDWLLHYAATATLTRREEAREARRRATEEPRIEERATEEPRRDDREVRTEMREPEPPRAPREARATEGPRREDREVRTEMREPEPPRALREARPNGEALVTTIFKKIQDIFGL